MSKQTGLGDNFYIAGYDLSGDTLSLGSIGGGPALLDYVTAIDKSAYERTGGLIDGGLELETAFNDATDQEHDVYSTLPTTDVIAMYTRGTALGSAAAGLVGKQVNYDWDRGNDGALVGSVEMVANGYGIEWGVLLTAGIRTDGGATSGAAVDLGATQTLGMRAFLIYTAFTGTDVTVTIEDSATGSSGWAAIGSGAFTQITSGVGAERIETGGAEQVQRYVRAVTSTTGGFTDLQFAVLIAQNATAVVL